jgi:hypothetical protein
MCASSIANSLHDCSRALITISVLARDRIDLRAHPLRPASFLQTSEILKF